MTRQEKHGYQPDKGTQTKEGYKPIEKGYRPTQGDLDSSNPPKGGTGVPPKIQPGTSSGSSTDSEDTEKKD